MGAAAEAAVGSPWEAVGSHTAEVGVGRSRAVAGIGLGEGCFAKSCVSDVVWDWLWRSRGELGWCGCDGSELVWGIGRSLPV